MASLRGFNGFSPQFAVILSIAFFSLALTLYLAVTPLKSASHGQDFHLWPLESRHEQVYAEGEREEGKEEDMIRETDDVASAPEVEPLFQSSLDVEFDPPEERDSSPPESPQEESTEVVEESPEVKPDCHVAEEVENQEDIPLKPTPPVQTPEAAKGLGRSARRTFAAILDEFWGSLFDLHGKVTQEALAKRLDILLGLDRKTVDPQPKVEMFPSRNPRTYTPSLLGQAGLPTSWSLSSSSLQQPSSWNTSQTNALEAAERRYSSLRLPHNNNNWDYQPATIHGSQISSHVRGLNSSSRYSHNPNSPDRTFFGSSYKGPFRYPQEEEEERAQYSPISSSALQKRAPYEPPLQSGMETNGPNKKYRSLPSISQWGPIGNFDFDFDFDSVGGPTTDTKSLWARQPFEQFFEEQKEPLFSYAESEAATVRAVRVCVQKMMKLEGSEWLFKQEGGADEWIVNQIAAKERFLVEVGVGGNPEGVTVAVLSCGESCVWRMGLVVSFGLWCIMRVLELSQLESRPELWGKYTYVLNRLQVKCLLFLGFLLFLESTFCGSLWVSFSDYLLHLHD